MTKRGVRPKGKVDIMWSANFAYAIGLIVTDGCLSSDERHITFTSKDEEQIKNFLSCLNINSKIGINQSGYKRTEVFRVQVADVVFYKFLLSIGITSAKSKIIEEIKIPEKYFFDFLRGCFDGDGTFSSYWDKRWRSSHMFYLEFASASPKHIQWLRSELKKRLGVIGHVSRAQKSAVGKLKYAKQEALEIISKMYYNPRVVYLARKHLKIKKALAVEEKQQKKYISTK